VPTLSIFLIHWERLNSEQRSRCQNVCYAYVTLNSSSFDIQIADESGQVRVLFKKLIVNRVKNVSPTSGKVYLQSVWEKSVIVDQSNQLPGHIPIMIFDTSDSFYNVLRKQSGTLIILVQPGETFQRVIKRKDDPCYYINPDNPKHYVQLFESITEHYQLPEYLVHLWSQPSPTAERLNEQSLNHQLQMGLYSLFQITQRLIQHKPKKDISLLYVSSIAENAPENPLFGAISGFAKTVKQENPRLHYKTVALSSPVEQQLETLLTELLTHDHTEVRYQQDQRWIKTIAEFDPIESHPSIRREGVYLITGGAGGLGFIFGEYLAREFEAKVVLTGRSPLNPKISAKIERLNTTTAGEVIYLSADVSKRVEVETLISQIKNRFQQINGIIHSAGLTQDSYIINKSLDDIDRVLKPKVFGTVYLDEVSQSENLDFFVLFSSAASVLGNAGQSDYAFANSFLDHFAKMRESLRVAQKRSGKTLSINWPLWREGGMRVDDATERFLYQTYGMTPLETQAGLDAFTMGLSPSVTESQLMIIQGSAEQIRRALGLKKQPVQSKPSSSVAEPKVVRDESDVVLKNLQSFLMGMISQILKVKQQDIDPTEYLSNYGVDSISSMMFATQVNETYHLDLMPTIFFEYSSIQSFSEYLYQEHREQIEKVSSPVENAMDSSAVNLEPIAEQKTVTNSNESVLKVQSVEQRFPLSYGQKALWFVYQLAPESPAYNVALIFSIRSEVDIQTLRDTFQALLDRHSGFRTRIVKDKGGEPVQKILEHEKICFEVTDVSDWDSDKLNQQIKTLYQQPFDLEQGPVFRVNLLTRGQQDHVLLFNAHHIVFDGWSLWMIMDELGQSYSAIKNGLSYSLPPIEYSYADYVKWQNDMLNSPKGEQLWNYWKAQLSGELPVLNFPTDKPRPPVQSFANGKTLHFSVTDSLTQRIRTFAQSEGVTPYMILVAAFQILLHRYTGQNDILLGSLATGRGQSEFTKVSGYFVNPIVLREHINHQTTVTDFLGQVRQTVLGALKHQDYPFPLLVDRLKPERDSSRTPIFQVMFIFQRPQEFEEITELLVPTDISKGTRVKLGELELEPYQMSQQEGQFDLTVEMLETKRFIFGDLKYNADLFDESTMTRLIGHLQTILDGMVVNPSLLLSELPLLTDTEKQQLLIDWNNTNRDYSLNHCVHQLFESQADNRPNAIAIVFENQQLTYQALNNKANQVAQILQNIGIQPDHLVGLYVERSPEMVIGLLGTLKAGGGYVPLDPTYPAERLSYMIEDSGVSVILTQQSLSDSLSSILNDHRIQRIHLDDLPIIDNQDSVLTNCESLVQPANRAYVIYTSGSTGKPKGVQISHQALMNFLKTMADAPGLTKDDTLMAVTTISFDIAGLELYLPLIIGAKVILASQTLSNNPEELSNAIDKTDTTILQATPATWQMLLTTGWQGKSSLKILTGGEALSQQLAGQLIQKGKQVWNMYGPTETTIWSAVSEVHRNRLFKTVSNQTDSFESIGQPIGNTTIYILDKALNPVPIGIPGELYIGGIGLSRGYLNRPKLTAERFIPDPFSHQPGSRMYQTGDLAQYQTDGTIKYLSRIDNQVKIRGFRIELGEIETVLAKHPEIQVAVVITHRDTMGFQTLVGYIIPVPGAVPSVSEWRDFLSARLPNYMIPASFVMLNEFPLTPNGKIDRRALPKPDSFVQAVKSDLNLPTQPTEKRLADIWSQILGRQQIGLDENFFQIGGNSLLATQLIFQVRDTFSIPMPVSGLFELPTIAGLARYVDNMMNQSISSQKDTTISTNFESAEQQMIEILKRLEIGEIDVDQAQVLYAKIS
jgi:iturin family lipopeptide synthetase A